ncbi:MAG: hypothetical protein KDA61_02060, partial [Planctomycetales bacterium]|nr:hypothetical protein [Planctomycetales bacterium]
MRQLTSHETLSGAIQRCICKGVVLATTAFALIGCSRPAEVPAAAVGSVAVIDLDAVAQSLGSDKQIAQSLSSRQSSLNDQLVKLANSYTEKLEQQKQAASQSANGPQVELASWQQQASANLTKARQQVESDLAQHRAKLVAQFRQ